MKKKLIISMFILALFPILVFAKNIDVTKLSELEIDYIYDDEIVLENTNINLYKIADYDSNGNIKLKGYLENYNLDIDGDINLQSDLIYSYIIYHNILPEFTAKTDNLGICILSNVPVGLYLIKGETIIKNGYSYIPENYIISIPSKTNGNLYYNLTSNPKILREKEKNKTLYVTKQLLINWNDYNDYLKLRPKSLTFQLLQNGVIYDEVSLSEENNWRFVWDNLLSVDTEGYTYTYTIVPSDIEDYIINLNVENDTFSVTNTLNDYQKEKIETDDNKKEDTIDSVTNYEIPKIYLLWWPIYLSLFIGITLLGIGIFNIKLLDFHNKGKVYIIISSIFLIISILFLMYNMYISIVSKKKMNDVYNKMIQNINESSMEYNEYTYLPTIKINNDNYVGYLSIPSLNYNVPILNEWHKSYNLPAKFYGSPYSNNIYICSKNYYNLFINLLKLKIGDEITFNDLDGNTFNYVVTEISNIKSKNINEELINNKGLMLFTGNIYSINKVLVINCETKNTY